MSRIGRLPINVPNKVEVAINNNQISVKGPKGSLNFAYNKDMTVELQENQIFVKRPSDEKKYKSLHGQVIMPEIEGITVEVPNPNKIVVHGVDKQKVGQFAAEIRGKRPPEPYKGKGIKYSDEVIRRKEGKAGKGKK